MSISPEEKLEIKKKTHKQLMYVGIFSILMMFAGLSSAYIVSKSEFHWFGVGFFNLNLGFDFFSIAI